MVDHNALITVLGDYARTISQAYDIGEVLYRLADQAVAVLEVDGAGVSVADDTGRLRFVSATDEDMVRIEETQLELGEGPCQQAFNDNEIVRSDDLREEDRWPTYTPTALARGCRAVLGIPMHARSRQIGALNIYSRVARPWAEEEVDLARTLADMASGYIVNALTLREAEQMKANLQHALHSRVVVEQAKGALVERHHIPAAEAFERMRGHARSHRRRVHDVARDILDGRLDL